MVRTMVRTHYAKSLCPEHCCPHPGQVDVTFTFQQYVQDIPERDFLTVPFSSPRLPKFYHCVREVFFQQLRVNILPMNEIGWPKIVVQGEDGENMQPTHVVA